MRVFKAVVTWLSLYISSIHSLSLRQESTPREVSFHPDPTFNPIIDTIIQRFLISMWFKAVVSPYYFVDEKIRVSRLVNFENIRIGSLGQPFKRIGSVQSKPHGSGKLLKVTLGTWNNLTLDTDYNWLGGGVSGSLSGVLEELKVSITAHLQGINTPDFKVSLRNFNITDHGIFHLTSLSGLSLLNTPTRYLLNLVLPRFQDQAVPLIEDKVKEILTLMLNDPHTISFLRP